MANILDHKFAESDFVGKGASSLPNRPREAGMDGTAVKAVLDNIAKVMIALGKHNDLIDNLLSTTDGNSGADSIGVTAIPGVTGATTQAVLESLKTLIDATVIDQIPDNSLAEIKMANEMKKDIEGGVASYDIVSTKAPLANPTFTGTVGGISSAMVGLGNVDNVKQLPLSGGTMTGSLYVNAGIASRLAGAETKATEISYDSGYDSGILKSIDAGTTFKALTFIASSLVFRQSAAGVGDPNYLFGVGTALPATTGTMTATMDSPIKTITPSGACTFNASGGITGQRCSFVITTSGTTSYTLTWSTNFKTTGTLATGTVTAKKFVVEFIYDGSTWCETSRTTAM